MILDNYKKDIIEKFDNNMKSNVFSYENILKDIKSKLIIKDNKPKINNNKTSYIIKNNNKNDKVDICLTTPDNDNDPLKMKTCYYGENQFWIIDDKKRIKNINSNKCVDIAKLDKVSTNPEDNKSDYYSNIILRDCNEVPTQKWNFDTNNRITSGYDAGKCLYINDNNVIVKQCKIDENQKDISNMNWKAEINNIKLEKPLNKETEFYLKNKIKPNFCLSVPDFSTEIGQEIELHDCNQIDNQIWSYDPEKDVIQNKSSDKFINLNIKSNNIVQDIEGKPYIFGGDGTIRSKDQSNLCLQINDKDPTKVMETICDNTLPSQQWEIHKHYPKNYLDTSSDIAYSIMNKSRDNYCLEINNRSNDIGENIRGWDCRKNPSQFWIYDNEERLKNVNSNKCIDIKYDNNNANIVQMECNNDDSQKWIYNQNNMFLSKDNIHKCLNITDTNNGSLLQLDNCKDDKNSYKFSLHQQKMPGSSLIKGKIYRLINDAEDNKYCLEIGKSILLEKVNIGKYKNLARQMWKYDDNERLVNLKNGKCLTVLKKGKIGLSNNIIDNNCKWRLDIDNKKLISLYILDRCLFAKKKVNKSKYTLELLDCEENLLGMRWEAFEINEKDIPQKNINEKNIDEKNNNESNPLVPITLNFKQYLSNIKNINEDYDVFEINKINFKKLIPIILVLIFLKILSSNISNQLDLSDDQNQEKIKASMLSNYIYSVNQISNNNYLEVFLNHLFIFILLSIVLIKSYYAYKNKQFKNSHIYNSFIVGSLITLSSLVSSTSRSNTDYNIVYITFIIWFLLTMISQILKNNDTNNNIYKIVIFAILIIRIIFNIFDLLFRSNKIRFSDNYQHNSFIIIMNLIIAIIIINILSKNKKLDYIMLLTNILIVSSLINISFSNNGNMFI
jgi:hypothetical protein